MNKAIDGHASRRYGQLGQDNSQTRQVAVLLARVACRTNIYIFDFISAQLGVTVKQ